MKRSDINKRIQQAILFFKEMNFKLPPWGYWSPAQWRKHQEACGEIFANGLGWDLTDFGSGDYDNTGLLLFTIRNGNLQEDNKP